MTSSSQGHRAAPVLAQGVAVSVALPASQRPSRQSQIDGLITQAARVTLWPWSQPTFLLSPAVAAGPGSSRIPAWQGSGAPCQGARAQMAATQQRRLRGPGCGSFRQVDAACRPPWPALLFSLEIAEELPVQRAPGGDTQSDPCPTGWGARWGLFFARPGAGPGTVHILAGDAGCISRGTAVPLRPWAHSTLLH